MTGTVETGTVAGVAGVAWTGGIVLGTDGSEGADRAVDWAAAEASRTGAGLTVVASWVHGGYGSTTPKRRDDARRVADEAVARVAERFPEVAATGKVKEGRPAPVLIEAGQGADLLVVGSRGLGELRGLLFGSVSQHCLTNATCSVAVVRSPADAAPVSDPARRVVVGVDGSDGSNLALDWAVDEAVRDGARLDVVAAWVFPATAGYVFTVDVGVPEAARQVADQAVARVAKGASGLTVGREVREETPAAALLEASQHADLVVVGSRGLGAFRGMLLGSVSQSVAQQARCTVVVVRDRDGE